MSRQNDFKSATKKRLAERAGYKCCYLSCGQATIGPSKEKNNTEKSNTGIAAHIYSASQGKGARRLPPEDMTQEEIISYQNGIWMCQTHGKYVDTDESTFSVDVLKRWKKIGEIIAKKMQEFNCSYSKALAELEYLDPEILKMIVFAQKHDPSANRYHMLDLTLYRKILRILSKSVVSCAREGFFANRHEASLRKQISLYLHKTKDEPIDFSFHHKKIQTRKETMDKTLKMLADHLATVTFWESIEGKEYYAMSSELKLTEEGLKHYITQENNIYKYSDKFVTAFDSFYKECRDYFLK